MSEIKTPIPKTIHTRVAYEGYFNVIVDQVKPPSEKHPDLVTYSRVDLKANAAAIIARTKEGKFIITKEYRHPLGKWVIGCPGGRIDEGESPIEAAKRELFEETGYANGTFSLLGSLYPLPAVTDQKIFYVLAENVTYEKAPTLEPLELIHAELKTQEELLGLLHQGKECIDGILCSGILLFLAKENGKRH